MKAAVQKEYGNPAEVLSVEDVEKPSFDAAVSKTCVLLKVGAASINPIDYKILDGSLKGFLPAPFPSTPGFDVAGTVEAVGADVTRFKVGDRVFGDNWNPMFSTLSEYIVAKQECLTNTPADLSDVEAASIPLAGLTSYQALLKHGGFKEGSKIFVNGGTTATGSYAIQLAKALGASHVACSASNVELAKSFGADTVVNYKEKDWGEELGDGSYDLVYETVGGKESWDKALKLLKEEGSAFVTLVGGIETTDARYKGMMCDNATGETDLEELRKLFESKKMKPYLEPSGPYKLTTDSVRAGFEKLQSHRAKGKIVFDCNVTA